MSHKLVDANSPCIVTGCTEKRYVQPNGQVRPRCWTHYQAWFRARNAKYQDSKPRPDLTVCIVDGCNAPRYVRPNGKRMPQCWEHHRAYYAAAARATYYRAKAQQGLKVAGRPQPPTVLISERTGMVRQIKGNTVVSEMKLPERGLNPHTLALLKRRGWRVKYETA